MDQHDSVNDDFNGFGAVATALEQHHTCAQRLALALQDSEEGLAFAELAESICRSHQLLTVMVACMPGYFHDMYSPGTGNRVYGIAERMRETDRDLAALAGLVRLIPDRDPITSRLHEVVPSIAATPRDQ